MVWPILISVAVTPRISAAVEMVGSARRATAPSAANPAYERIGFAPFFAPRSGGRGAAGIAGKTCHDQAAKAKETMGVPARRLEAGSAASISSSSAKSDQ